MAKVIIPQHLKGKELHRFLAANKAAIIAERKALPKYCDSIDVTPSLYLNKADGVIKVAAGETTLQDVDTIRVKVVANTALWCDSHMDVLLPDCWNKSIKERKGLLKHLHDHKYTLDAELGDTVNVYGQDMSLNDLGINKAGSTQCLIWESDIYKSYNKLAFEKYRDGKIKQHSIGLWYVKMELAINNEESEKEFDFWNKYIDKVINRDFVEEKGFFWVIPEIKLIENSAVLFGANQLTPTISVTDKSITDTEEEPSEDTPTQPSSNKNVFAKIGATKQSSLIGRLGKQLS